MRWEKVIFKGFEKAVLAGGTSVAATGADSEKIIVDIIAATLGFLWGAGRNWWKNRKKGAI